jgi:hypothetical protein
LCCCSRLCVLTLVCTQMFLLVHCYFCFQLHVVAPTNACAWLLPSMLGGSLFITTLHPLLLLAHHYSLPVVTTSLLFPTYQSSPIATPCYSKVPLATLVVIPTSRCYSPACVSSDGTPSPFFAFCR